MQTPVIQWEEKVGSLSYGYLPNVRKAFCRSPSISLSIDSAISFLVNWQTAREQELLCAKRRALACTRNAETLIQIGYIIPPSKFPILPVKLKLSRLITYCLVFRERCTKLRSASLSEYANELVFISSPTGHTSLVENNQTRVMQ